MVTETTDIIYAIVDIETTGGKFNQEKITEIAIYKIKNNGNISNILFSVRKPDFFEIIIDIEVRDANHLQNIIAALRMEKEVSSLERLKG